MHIMFDVKGTVLGLMDNSLRPGIKDLIVELRRQGHEVSFWTGGITKMKEYREVLSKNGIPGEIYSKNLALPFNVDLFVDDDEEVVPGKTLMVKSHVCKDFDDEDDIRIDISSISRARP